MRRPRWFWPLAGGALVLLVAAALYGPPVILEADLRSAVGKLSPVERATAINQIRTAIVQAAAALVVLTGAYVAWQQLQHNVRAAREQIEAQRAATLTDRYTRAVEQLANDEETIRVGAIHALDRIATPPGSGRTARHLCAPARSPRVDEPRRTRGAAAFPGE